MKFSFTNKNPDSLPKDLLRISLVTTSEETHYFRNAKGTAYLILGVKEETKLSRRKALLLIRRITREARARKARKICVDMRQMSFPAFKLTGYELGRIFAENALMANYEYEAYKTKRPYKGIEECVLCGAGKEEQAGVIYGATIGEAINACRDLSNMPGGDMTPERLAKEAHALMKGTNVKVTVLGEKEMRVLNMGAILGVSRGSRTEAKFIIAEYRGAQKNDVPVVLVGKGVTFDSGGLNLKPSDALTDMHLDMSGAAAVLAVIAAAARLKLKVNVVALVPAAENMPSGESYRPGDVLRTMNGKTIEVGNTDAEGRLLLADALSYAKRYKPSVVIDVATLTGGAIVTMGLEASIMMSPDDTLIEKLRALGEESGDYIWPLPLWEEYERLVKGTYADLTNSSSEHPRYAQSIVGGMFLKQFAEGYPWVHIDMAPREVSTPKEFLSKGAAGAPVRLLVRFLELCAKTNASSKS